LKELRLRHHRRPVCHDFPKRAAADAECQSAQLPVMVQHLRAEGLSPAFITYMSERKGFVTEEEA